VKKTVLLQRLVKGLLDFYIGTIFLFAAANPYWIEEVKGELNIPFSVASAKSNIADT